MASAASRSSIDQAAGRLRAEVMAREVGAFLGSEEALERLLGVSKPTVRQAARLLEREGLLRVRRGKNGGYFGARPDPAFIEETVANYLEVLRARPEDLTRVATALWIETVREAAALAPERRAKLATRFRRDIARLPETASFSDVLALERRIQRAVFDLVGSSYVELIFNINANFARRQFAASPAALDGSDEHAGFVDAWRRAATLELEAISTGDVEIAVLAAGRSRAFIHRRIWPESRTSA